MTYRHLLSEIHSVLNVIRPPDDTPASHLRQRQMQYRKWQLVHEYVRLKPFRDKPRRPRSQQWQDAMNEVREIRDNELIDWLWQQAEIARNFENGVQDMRPRPKGTCHEALLRYLNMREDKAKRVLNWEEDSQKHGCFRVNSTFHQRTQEILARHRHRQRQADNSDPDPEWDPNDPWFRS